LFNLEINSSNKIIVAKIVEPGDGENNKVKRK
jgi:hypothetical protein